jgi:hypothetical protein
MKYIRLPARHLLYASCRWWIDQEMGKLEIAREGIRMRTQLFGLILACALLVIGNTAYAATILSYARINDGYDVDTQYSFVSGTSATASIESQHQISLVPSGQEVRSEFFGTGTANGFYGGIFQASGAVTLTDYIYQTFWTVCPSGTVLCIDPALQAGTIVGDAFNFSSDVSNVSEGYLVLTLDVEGSATLSSDSISDDFWAEANASFLIWNGPTNKAPIQQWHFSGSETIISDPIPIALGEFEAFNFGFQVNAYPFDIGTVWFPSVEEAEGIDPMSLTSDVGPYDFSATVNFGNTVTLANMQIFSDENLQNEIIDFTIASESGAQYPGGTEAVVPIPTAAWLFGSAMIGIAGLGRRNARRRASA